jgi:PTS system mannose-specific IIB component
MPAVLYRVDNRLVHGQVLEAWVPRVGADTILVVDDNLVKDDFHKTVLEAMGHSRLKIIVVDCANAASRINGELSGKKVLVLFHDTKQAKQAYSAGLDYMVLNLGNIHPGKLSTKLTSNVNLSKADAHRICVLISKGVKVDARAVPADKSPDVGRFCHALDKAH